jgi:hypothetical protein
MAVGRSISVRKRPGISNHFSEQVMSASLRCLATMASIVLVAPLISAQPLDGDMRFAALGGASAAARLHIGPSANPASLADLRGGTIMLFTAQGFGMPELRSGGTAASLGVGRAVVGLQSRTFGFDEYRETSTGIDLAGVVFPATTRPLQLGARLSYLHTGIAEYGTSGVLGLSLGVIFSVAEGIDAGGWMSNINQPSTARGDPSRSELIVGVSIRRLQQVAAYLDVAKDPLFPLSLKGGLEVFPLPRLAFRVGTSTYPETISTGAGVRVADTTIDIAVQRHRWLGWTPGISASISF